MNYSNRLANSESRFIKSYSQLICWLRLARWFACITCLVGALCVARGADYSVVVSARTASDAAWRQVADTLVKRHRADLVVYTNSVVEALPGGDMPQGWYGFFGPARLPRPIVARLNGDILKILADRETRAKIEESTFAVLGGTPEDFAEMVRNSLDVYAKIVQAAGVKAE